MAEGFRRLCRKSRVSNSEGVRQLVARYLENPFKFQPSAWGEDKSANLPHALDTKQHTDAIARHAKRAGITHSEAIRQIVQRYLDEGQG